MDIEYKIIKSKRKTVAIHIDERGHVIVKAPFSVSNNYINNLVNEKSDWIKDKQEYVRKSFKEVPQYTPREIYIQKERARKIIPMRVNYYNEKYFHKKIGKITIKDTKSRWGSCSSLGNLNFSYRLVNAPMEVLDYVVVHELCHLLHMNHSPEFWQEVGGILPDYEVRKKWLKDNGKML